MSSKYEMVMVTNPWLWFLSILAPIFFFSSFLVFGFSREVVYFELNIQVTRYSGVRFPTHPERVHGTFGAADSFPDSRVRVIGHWSDFIMFFVSRTCFCFPTFVRTYYLFLS
ncbi:hypothetical protein DM02DRAFT_113310 [Periconia macrospinosa]|uniref:Uncharacterized protein n=1 Tax=Periconia macrospinosa TaxID=97972 RepID=A0A2V1E598_9PLEO|nr:hypothetical protein DM02DRAFT_113310 [Periconia macrospinosa]